MIGRARIFTRATDIEAGTRALGPVMTTESYNVVMTVVSIRFADVAVERGLKRAAAEASSSISATAERLIREGLRMQDHPRIIFRDGPAGRRPRVIGGQDVWVVVTTVVGGDVPVDDRVERAADLLSLSVHDVDAAMRYYAEFTDEVDADIESRRVFAAEAESLWRRQQQLTAS